MFIKNGREISEKSFLRIIYMDFILMTNIFIIMRVKRNGNLVSHIL